MDKSLKNKAIDIKGRQYVLVADRILYFAEVYPLGSISTQIISDPNQAMVIVKATVTPDVSTPARIFTGYSQAVWGEGMVNKTAALENAETSAVGRALAMMGIGVIESIASADEVNKAQATDGAEGVCSTCSGVMRRSKAGNLYCPNLYNKDPNNPHHQKPAYSQAEESFIQSLE